MLTIYFTCKNVGIFFISLAKRYDVVITLLSLIHYLSVFAYAFETVGSYHFAEIK